MALANNTWSFTSIADAFPQTVLPNVAYWNVTNGADLQYQVSLSWPLDWASTRDVQNKTALTMYVLDGNALGMSATEAWRRRDAVETGQPDYIIVSIGYPITDSVYGAQRGVDFQPVTPGEEPPAVPGVRQGADDLIAFIEVTLRPFVRGEVFPGVEFGREALYGHSFGGLFVVYALLRRPDLVDTFLAASPALYWNEHYILNHTGWLDDAEQPAGAAAPSFRLAYGGLEQDAVRRRTETVEGFEARVALLRSFGLLKMGTECRELMEKLGASSRLRDAELKEYTGSDHASVGALALTDGLDYFIDW